MDTADRPPQLRLIPGLRGHGGENSVPLGVGKGVWTKTRTTILDPDEGRDALPSGLNLLVMSLDSFACLPLPATGSLFIGRSAACDVHLEDPLASRQHACLHLTAPICIEDLKSANRTRVRDAAIGPGERVPIAPGDAIKIGSTVLVIQRGEPSAAQQRLWSHRHFEARVATECSRAQASGGSLALVRLRLERPASWTKVVPILAAAVPPPNLFAAYSANDYEFLIAEADPDEVARTVEAVEEGLGKLELPVKVAAAWYPRDGRTGDALLASANSMLRPAQQAASEPRVSAAHSGPMREAYDLAKRAARANINVLIVGETGVGKEVMAEIIHRQSSRADKPFVAINCAGLSETLIESELFGYEKGAFTGALQSKKGLFETAQGGTLFLDEIGEVPMSLQPRLLRAIETREVLPVGGLKRRPIDVRFLAATNRDLEDEQERGTFRRDLYFRLNGIMINIPPLRERRSEIRELAETFCAHAAQEAQRGPLTIAPTAMAQLLDYDWPGNIRELRNVIERAVVLCEGDVIEVEHLPIEKMRGPSRPGLRKTSAMKTDPAVRLLTSEEMQERERIIKALDDNVWNQSRTARALKISRRTLISKLDRLEVPRPQKNAGREDRVDRDDESGEP
jgi:two-component system response regulator AtoC